MVMLQVRVKMLIEKEQRTLAAVEAAGMAAVLDTKVYLAMLLAVILAVLAVPLTFQVWRIA